MNGKGSVRRGDAEARKRWSQNWDVAFGKKRRQGKRRK